MASLLTLHKVGAPLAGGASGPSQLYYFKTSDAYKGIEDVCGVTKATGAADDENPTVKVEELLRAAVLVRVHLEYTTTGGKKAKEGTLLIARTLLKDVFGGSLNGKSYVINGVTKGTIKDVFFARRARFSMV